MRTRPARPLDPPLDPLRTKNVEKGSKTKKKKRARTPPTRALRWGRMHLSGIFLDGSAKGESTEVDEVEHILEVRDQTPSGDEQTVVAELDLEAERERALDLLGGMFGETSTDWGGVENIDLDVETAGVDADTPRAAAPSSHLPIPQTFKSCPLPTHTVLPRGKRGCLLLTGKWVLY